MEAKSLMIGDWVKCHDQYKQIQYIYCRPLHDGANPANEIGWGAYEESWVNAGNVEPVPLTREILEKNGFADGILPYTLCNTELQLSMQDNNGFWAFSIYAEHTEFCDLMMNYVHELQHALRLCDLNELADNFKVQ